MHNLKAIRKHLGVTQEELGKGIGCTQGNVYHYEQGQTLLPEMARKVIDFAKARGLEIGFDHIYGTTALPKREEPQGAETGQPSAA